MLGFLTWGRILNVYAFIVTLIATRIVIPKSERKRDSKNIVTAVITVMLVPYMMMVLCLCAMIVLAVCKFDYEELKKLKRGQKGFKPFKERFKLF